MYLTDEELEVAERWITELQDLFAEATALKITDYARAACGLQYKMDYMKIKETNITMCYQLYFALRYSALKANLNN